MELVKDKSKDEASELETELRLAHLLLIRSEFALQTINQDHVKVCPDCQETVAMMKVEAKAIKQFIALNEAPKQ